MIITLLGTYVVLTALTPRLLIRGVVYIPGYNVTMGLCVHRVYLLICTPMGQKVWDGHIIMCYPSLRPLVIKIGINSSPY